MTLEISADLKAKLTNAQIIWLTTVRADGLPQPTPVWFLWSEGTFLVFSQPAAKKLANIRHNSHVALNLNSNQWGGDVVVITGEAVIETTPVSQAEMDAYLTKYQEGIKSINLTPDKMKTTYSAVIRIKPAHIRNN